jgi:hypothetical protein
MGWAARRGTSGQQREPDGRLAELGRDFPGWQPWRSSAGRWWAVRRLATPPPGAPDEWARTVDGDTPRELRAALAEQEGLAGHERGAPGGA